MNKIQLENGRPGTLDWQLDAPAMQREIEGYASQTSVNLGESLLLFVNTESPTFSIAIYRMGWYDGNGARHFETIPDLKGIKQPIPLPDSDFGLVDCDWKTPYELKIGTDWTTGIYLAKLEENRTRKQSYIIFVVRDDASDYDIIFQLPVTTYQAYNFWGGKSLYDWGSGSDKNWGTISGKRASKVSFNRPYALSNNKKASHGMGAGEFLTNVQPVTTHFFPISSASWDYNMVRWLEKNGYNIGYITNIDTHENPDFAKQVKIFMSHGHDEYWSSQMRGNVEEALEHGVNLAFFSSNTMFWQVRFEPSQITQSANRIMVCYKDLSDPISGKFTTVNFRDAPICNPESKLIGVQHFMDPVDGDIIVSNDSHVMFENTGLKNGDKIEGLLGYEIDTVTEHSPKNIEILTTSPGRNLLEDNYSYVVKQVVQKILRKTSKVLGAKKIPKMVLALIGVALFCAVCYLSNKVFGEMGFVLLSFVFFVVMATFFFYIHRRVKLQNRSLSTKGNSNMTLYISKNGAKVFSTGSMQWSWGLDDYNMPKLRTSRKHENVEIITRNVISYLLSESEN